MERSRGGRPRHPDILTPAEWRVLGELRKGGTNAEIAVRLGVSPDAVKYHISNMLGKLELEDRHALAAWQAKPEGMGSRIRALLALPSAFSSLGRTIAWAAAMAVLATVAVVLVAVLRGGEEDPRLPAEIQLENGAVQVSAGNGHSCVVRESGEIVCWGDN
ncbi:MAG: hypothetical protein F4Z07_12315, partial [Dehalococcoidia bacterium]|nr:hypothetical protein [Dehalococcoidia bacterium]